MKLPLSIFLLILTFSLQATPRECKKNGCGSGWNEILVPDSLPLTKIDFTESCGSHDLCYSKCISKCNHFSGEKKCDKNWKIDRKAKCDDDFLDNMFTACEKSYSWAKNSCEDLALVYFEAVSRLGWSNFQGYIIADEDTSISREPNDILHLKVEKYLLEKKSSDFIDAIKRSPFKKGRDFEKLFIDKHTKLQEKSSSKLTNQNLDVFIQEKLMSPDKQLEMEEAVNELMKQ